MKTLGSQMSRQPKKGWFTIIYVGFDFRTVIGRAQPAALDETGINSLQLGQAIGINNGKRYC